MGEVRRGEVRRDGNELVAPKGNSYHTWGYGRAVYCIYTPSSFLHFFLYQYWVPDDGHRWVERDYYLEMVG